LLPFGIIALSVGEYVKCLADGNPEPTLTWLRTCDQHIVSFDSYLTINETGDNHTYICSATNVVKGRTFSETSYKISGYCNLLNSKFLVIK